MLPLVQCLLHLLNGIETFNMVTLLLLTGGYDVLERYADTAINSICANRYFHTTDHYRHRNIPGVSPGAHIFVFIYTQIE